MAKKDEQEKQQEEFRQGAEGLPSPADEPRVYDASAERPTDQGLRGGDGVMPDNHPLNNQPKDQDYLPAGVGTIISPDADVVPEGDGPKPTV